MVSDPPTYHPKAVYDLPVILHICAESREVGLKRYTLPTKAYGHSNYDLGYPLAFDNLLFTSPLAICQFLCDGAPTINNALQTLGHGDLGQQVRHLMIRGLDRLPFSSDSADEIGHIFSLLNTFCTDLETLFIESNSVLELFNRKSDFLEWPSRIKSPWLWMREFFEDWIRLAVWKVHYPGGSRFSSEEIFRKIPKIAVLSSDRMRREIHKFELPTSVVLSSDYNPKRAQAWDDLVNSRSPRRWQDKDGADLCPSRASYFLQVVHKDDFSQTSVEAKYYQQAENGGPEFMENMSHLSDAPDWELSECQFIWQAGVH